MAHTEYAHAGAHLARATSAGVGETGSDGSGRGSGRGSTPSQVGRRAAAAGGNDQERRSICEGKNGRLGHAWLPNGSTHERTAAALQQALHLLGRGEQMQTCQGQTECEARAVWCQLE